MKARALDFCHAKLESAVAEGPDFDASRNSILQVSLNGGEEKIMM
jgi:hypothetical protein